MKPTSSSRKSASDLKRLTALKEFVQLILKGKHPTNMPIEQPTKYDLAINIKTAKAIGVNIPSTLLLRVDALLE